MLVAPGEIKSHYYVKHMVTASITSPKIIVAKISPETLKRTYFGSISILGKRRPNIDVIRNHSSKLYYDHHGTLATLKYPIALSFRAMMDNSLTTDLCVARLHTSQKDRLRAARP